MENHYMDDLVKKALQNMEYPGRMIILGRNREGTHVVVLYAVTGRSPSSQARKMDVRKDGIWTEPTDFIRFFPSFCLAHSFRFREISPP